jgi:signal transduction histidine kinase
MKQAFWQRLSERPFGGAASAVARLFPRLIEALKIPAPEAPEWIRRITIMERHIILPLKAAAIVMLLSFYYQQWTNTVESIFEIADEFSRSFLWVYIGVNAVVAGLLLGMNRLPLPLIQWTVFGISLVDGIFLGVLTVVTGGYDSILYWLFLGLIVRSAVNVPRATSQLLLNLTLTACYVLAGIIDASIAASLPPELQKEAGLAGGPDNPTQPLFLRLALLLLMTFCCYGLQVLLKRHQQVLEEARELALREGQLRAAGRLAAEFAHQIKNPLAIINTAVFSLRRALKENKPADALEQLHMVQEEVEHSDLIITQIMGYAQLSEGHVEKLDVVEELNLAIERVFPPAAHYPVQVHRKYASSLPPLLMQRRHVSDSFINVLQNARDALGGKDGNIFVTARCLADSSVEVSIRDDGPGVPPDKRGRIFEAYFTTKEKGTGLGLATVKHNVELYGGSVRVESELGKGARFVLIFPARASLMPAKTI